MTTTEITEQNISNINERVLAKFINDKITRIISFVEKMDQISSLLAIGSLGTRTMRSYSNLHLVLVSKIDPSIIYQLVKELISKDLFYSLQKKNKLLYLLDFDSTALKRTFEIELYIINDIQDLREIFIGSRFTTADYKTINLVDKNNTIGNHLLEILKENELVNKNIHDFIMETAHNFIDFFIQGIFNYKKNDLFQYYSCMTNVYSELLKLEAIRYDNLENLHNPAFGLARIDQDVDLQYYKKIIPKISLNDITLRSNYIKRFCFLMKEIGPKYSVDFNISETEKTLIMINNESYFWNLRDISYLDMQHLKSHTFFRSSTLSRYTGSEELKNFLMTNNIKTIIDMRSRNELEFTPYKNISDQVKVIAIPISPKKTNDYSQLKYSDPNKKERFYEVFLRFYQDEIKEIFETLAQQEPGFVVHCYAGKDRTGIITGLLLELLAEKSNQLSKEIIVEDYLYSGSNTKLENFKIYKETLDEFGGSKNYLQKIGLTNESIEKIFQKFMI